jgi:hypothetical protein
MFGLSPVRDTKAARDEVRDQGIRGADLIGSGFDVAGSSAEERRG